MTITVDSSGFSFEADGAEVQCWLFQKLLLTVSSHKRQRESPMKALGRWQSRSRAAVSRQAKDTILFGPGRPCPFMLLYCLLHGPCPLPVVPSALLQPAAACCSGAPQFLCGPTSH